MGVKGGPKSAACKKTPPVGRELFSTIAFVFFLVAGTGHWCSGTAAPQ